MISLCALPSVSDSVKETRNLAMVGVPGKTHGFFGKLTAEIRTIAATLCSEAQGRILDVGCGNGLLFLAIGERKDVRLFGLDFSRELLSEGRQILYAHGVGNVHLIVGDAFHLPLTGERFDHVLFLNTLYNLASWEEVKRVLGEMMAACGPGGSMIFDIRNKGNPYIRLKYWWHRRKRTFATHAYGRKEIRRLLERNGFVVRREVPVGPVYCKAIPFAYVIEAERTSSP